MKALVASLCAALLLACGGGGGQPVPELSESEQESLCDDFVAGICDEPGFESFCTECVTTTACADAVEAGSISRECGPDPANGIDEITDDMVRECAATRSQDVCLMGGGCMFDAIEFVCLQ